MGTYMRRHRDFVQSSAVTGEGCEAANFNGGSHREFLCLHCDLHWGKKGGPLGSSRTNECERNGGETGLAQFLLLLPQLSRWYPQVIAAWGGTSFPCILCRDLHGGIFKGSVVLTEQQLISIKQHMINPINIKRFYFIKDRHSSSVEQNARTDWWNPVAIPNRVLFHLWCWV